MRIDPATFNRLTLTYLRLTGCPAGLLINVNVARLMDGVKRLINARANGDDRDTGCTQSH